MSCRSRAFRQLLLLLQLQPPPRRLQQLLPLLLLQLLLPLLQYSSCLLVAVSVFHMLGGAQSGRLRSDGQKGLEPIIVYYSIV